MACGRCELAQALRRGAIAAVQNQVDYGTYQQYTDVDRFANRPTTTFICTTTGAYVRLYCDFLFTRSLGFYMIQIYLPSILIVIISWVSFWLNREATPARVALGVTTVLTMTTLMTTTNVRFQSSIGPHKRFLQSQMPKVSYVKSIDIYLGTCFLMVFASLLEYAAVGYLNKKLRMHNERVKKLSERRDASPDVQAE